MPKYEVPIVYRGQCNYIVEARDETEARRIARIAFNIDATPTVLGNEWEEVERYGDIKEVNQ